MNPRLARLLLRLYPREWRERYGEEFDALLESCRDDFSTTMNVICAAISERIFPTQKGNSQHPHSFRAIWKQPSAFLPLAMSLVALAMVLAYVARYGVAHPADEGAVAHLWQLLMAGQMPIVACFAIKWLPRAPRQTLYILAQQAGAALASLAAVFFLGLG